MNKYRVWELIVFGMIIFCAFMYYYGDSKIQKISLISMVICFYIMVKLGCYYEKIKASKYLTTWLLNERILNLLQNSSHSDFIYNIETCSNLRSNSLHVKLLKEYIDNPKIKSKYIKFAIEKYYTDKEQEDIELADKDAYQKLKNVIENNIRNS